MMDKVNIIENLEELEWFLLREYEKSKDDIDTWYFRYHAVSDARELLKEQGNDIHHMGLIIEEYEKELKKQEAKEGHWIVLDFCANEGIYCSECHMKIFDRTTKPKKKLSQYCPHCGSRNEQFLRDGEVVFR